MSTPYTKLLRRTFIAASAGLMLAGTAPALAQGTVTLSTGASCNYSQMTVQPNGTISVTCTSGQNPTPQPGQATFGVTVPSATGNPGAGAVATVTRSGGPAEALMVAYSVSGAGCAGGSSGGMMMSAGTSQTIAFTLSQSAGQSCVVSITAPSGHAASPQSAAMSVAQTGPVTPVGCSPAAVNSVARSLDYGPVDQLRMQPGVIAYYPVIASPDGRFASVEFTQGQQPNTPGYATTEFSVSRCPGTIETGPVGCYYKSQATNNNKITVFTRTIPAWGWTNQGAIGSFGCLADPAQGQWYVNVRWTYASCPWGENNCGFSMQWAIGAW